MKKTLFVGILLMVLVPSLVFGQRNTNRRPFSWERHTGIEVIEPVEAYKVNRDDIIIDEIPPNWCEIEKTEEPITVLKGNLIIKVATIDDSDWFSVPVKAEFSARSLIDEMNRGSTDFSMDVFVELDFNRKKISNVDGVIKVKSSTPAGLSLLIPAEILGELLLDVEYWDRPGRLDPKKIRTRDNIKNSWPAIENYLKQYNAFEFELENKLFIDQSTVPPVAKPVLIDRGECEYEEGLLCMQLMLGLP